MEVINGVLLKPFGEKKFGINATKSNGVVDKEIIQRRYGNENLSNPVHFYPSSDSNVNQDDPAGDTSKPEDGFCEIEMEEEKLQDSKTDILDSDDTAERISPTETHMKKGENNDIIAVTPKINGYIQTIQPDFHLPKPEAPPGLSSSPPYQYENGDVVARSKSLSGSLAAVDMPSIGKFFKDRSNSLSATISKRLSSLKFDDGDDDYMNHKANSVDSGVTEFNISGLKVVVMLKKNDGEEQIKGRVSFFSRSNCRDCTAVRSFFRERGLKFVEINIDVYRQREKELIERTGSSQVPQIFFNDKLFGGLVALNSLRNSGGFEERLKEMLGKKCSGDAPAPPVYGFDDHEEESTDEMVGTVKVLRQRLPIQDRLMKMKIVKNCFAGREMVEVLIHHFDCGRKKAVEIGKQLARKHFIHHVFGENDFEDGNHYYRFLEHEPFVPKCYNFRGSTNDSEPKPAVVVGQTLHKIMSAILESYVSDDRRHVDYAGISKSEEFRRYVNLVQDLHRVDLLKLSQDEKLAFFLNLHNAMVIHAVIRVGCPEGPIDRRSFSSNFQYIVGGSSYSLNTITNGILRSNRRSPYSVVKPFGTGDKRLEVALPKVNPLIHFGLCNGTRSSPTVRFFTSQGIESELRCAAREFFQRNGMEVDLEKRTVHLTRIIKWFSGDFGQEKEILRCIINYLDATKAGLLTHLLGDGGPVNIVYQDYDSSINS
ncbi:F26K24.21 PROTEIN [Salix purpurea]|uniref:F26K24.21 PROTEIN n=1 Tax=Salix purpurea TaxID=77065 RepID=A0A9Q0U9T7_SALPP|nr:F26K24.21 PROTEIN [Salix purpurea]